MKFFKKLFAKILKRKGGTNRKIDYRYIEKQKLKMQLKYDSYGSKLI